MLIEGAEPFFLPHGTEGVLLIHGFTGMPPEMRLLAESLQQAGYSALCPRLAGHGTSPEDMERTHAEDWYNSVLDGYFLLRGFCRRVAVIGHSLGALLALRLTTEQKVYAAVSLAAPIYIAEERGLADLPPREASVGKFYPKLRPRLQDVPASCQTAYKIAYKKMPLLSVHELVDFMKTTEAFLPKVQVPLLLFHGRHDHTARKESATYIYQHVASRQKEMHYVEAGHMLMLENAREEIFRQTVTFLRQAFTHDKGA